MFSLHSYFRVKFGAALSSHITRSSAGGRYGSYSMQKLLRKLQGARLYGSRDARLNFLLSQVGSPGEAKCVLFMPRLLASAYRTHNLLWCVELYAEIDPASFANSGGWWFHTQLSVQSFGEKSMNLKQFGWSIFFSFKCGIMWTIKIRSAGFP